ncbi:MAG: hypothetical protein KDJ28_15265 [Candidatus Competibacteraceae bacterium]|nr:hypothetical protein [Candidatus Competibacteraceae bacterium]
MKTVSGQSPQEKRLCASHLARLLTTLLAVVLVAAPAVVETAGVGESIASTRMEASIATGWTHTIALRADGTVWTWGGNDRGQLGDGTTNSRVIPAPVADLQGIVAVSAGSGSHHLSVLS